MLEWGGRQGKTLTDSLRIVVIGHVLLEGLKGAVFKGRVEPLVLHNILQKKETCNNALIARVINRR